MIFSYLSQVLFQTGCCTSRKKNQDQANLIIRVPVDNTEQPMILRPEILRVQIEYEIRNSQKNTMSSTPLLPKRENPEELLNAVKEITPEEQALMREAIIEEPRNTKRKTVQKLSPDESLVLLRLLEECVSKTSDQMWTVVHQDDVVIFMNKTPIDETSLKDNAQVYCHFLVNAEPQRVLQALIDPELQKQSDEKIETFIRFEENDFENIWAYKHYIQYKPTVFTSQSETILEVVIEKKQDCIVEATRSIIDERYPFKDDMPRNNIVLRGHTIRKLKDEPNPPEFFKDKDPALTLVSMYHDITVEEYTDYAEIEESVVDTVTDHIHKIENLLSCT